MGIDSQTEYPSGVPQWDSRPMCCGVVAHLFAPPKLYMLHQFKKKKNRVALKIKFENHCPSVYFKNQSKLLTSAGLQQRCHQWITPLCNHISCWMFKLHLYCSFDNWPCAALVKFSRRGVKLNSGSVKKKRGNGGRKSAGSRRNRRGERKRSFIDENRWAHGHTGLWLLHS